MAHRPAGLDDRVLAALATRGIDRPFTHQAAAVRATLASRNAVVVTPTASGKTVCYTARVLNAFRSATARSVASGFP